MVDIVFDGKVSSGSLDVNSSTVIDGVIDDDTMATASATNVPTAESVVAYLDASLMDVVDVSGASVSASVNTIYVLSNASQTTVTLPATYAVDDIVSVVGGVSNGGGWVIQASTGDSIRVLQETTSGGGTITSTGGGFGGECIDLVGVSADSLWTVKSFISPSLVVA